MTLDGLMLAGITRELAPLAGAKIEKIFQPGHDDIVLLLHTGEGKKRLQLSAAGGDSRIHITSLARPNPDKAPNFCMLLRKYISGGRIKDISQSGLERVVCLTIEARDDMGVLCEYRLYCEIMGKYSNMILVSPENTILDGIHRVAFDMSRVRQVLPSLTYAPPPRDKADPAGTDISALLEGLPVPDELPRALEGISFQTAGELVCRFFGSAEKRIISAEEAAPFAAFIAGFIKDALDAPHPCVEYTADGEPIFYSLVPYETFAGDRTVPYASANEAIDAYYTTRYNIKRTEELRAAVMRCIRKNTARIEKKLRLQWQVVADAEKRDTYRLYGELITANIYMIKRGMSSVVLNNYYTGEDITVPLDVRLSPQSNSARYFKKVGKLKNGEAIARANCEKYQAEKDYLGNLEYTASAATAYEDIADVRADLIRYGYMDAAPKEKIVRTDPLASPHEFLSGDGFKLLAGRNSRSNDALTLHVAGSEDIWFHVKNTPGSHVILFTGGREPSELALFQGAVIAATLSKAAASAKVEVDYVRRGNVWKANGARPGMVLYEKHNTIVVSPDAALVDSLRVQQG